MNLDQDQQERMKKLSKNSLICIVGARPNFMKIAPIMAALKKSDFSKPVILLHTGQHYDDRMSKTFFEALNIPDADINLGIGS